VGSTGNKSVSFIGADKAVSRKAIETGRRGTPWENPYIESFHDKLRDEPLNREIFSSLQEARVVTEDWRCQYNDERPHSSLGYKSPSRFAADFAAPRGQQSTTTTTAQD